LCLFNLLISIIINYYHPFLPYLDISFFLPKHFFSICKFEFSLIRLITLVLIMIIIVIMSTAH